MAHLHRSVVALRLCGDSLIPSEISTLLGAHPSSSQTKGDRIVGGKTGRIKIAKLGGWTLEAPSFEPENLDGQVNEILSRLTNDLGVWTGLAQQFRIDLFCGLFMAESNEGLSLSAHTLAALGQRSIMLELDIYGPGDD